MPPSRHKPAYAIDAAALAAVLLMLSTAPALAQVGGAVAVGTDYRLRGRSLSDGRGALTATASYDDRGGLYGDVAVVASTRPDGAPYLLGVIGDVGYAVSLADSWTLDAGLTRAHYAGRPGERSRGYSEAYVGAGHGGVSARLRYSPDYFGIADATLYAEVDAVVRPAPRWRILGHLGSLTYLGTLRSATIAQNQYDWRIGVARRVGPIDAQVAITGGGPGDDVYGGSQHSRTALIGMISWAL